jgi:hypothetical protein
MEGYLEIFWKEILWKKRKFRVMEKEIIFWGVETLGLIVTLFIVFPPFVFIY